MSGATKAHSFIDYELITIEPYMLDEMIPYELLCLLYSVHTRYTERSRAYAPRRLPKPMLKAHSPLTPVLPPD
jgi:hypothetical protein